MKRILAMIFLAVLFFEAAVYADRTATDDSTHSQNPVIERHVDEN